jgi:ABC-type transport system substrate-binding protein
MGHQPGMGQLCGWHLRTQPGTVGLPVQAGGLDAVVGAAGGDPLRWGEAGAVPQTADGRSVTDLLAAARASADSAERQALYREAEAILADGAATYAPLYHYSEVHLTRPYLQRTYRPGAEHFETWIIHG